MKTRIQHAIAAFVAVMIFLVFICPLTFGPPAPQQSQSPLAHLFAFVLVLSALLIARIASLAYLRALSPDEHQLSSDRLALICTRLC